MSIKRDFGLFHPVSEFSLYILFVSFLRNRNGLIKSVSVSSFNFVLPCFVTSTDKVLVCFIRFICYGIEIDLYKEVSVSSFHFISPSFVTSYDQGCRYVSFVSFVTKQKWIYIIKNSICFIVSFRFTLFITGIDQGFWSFSSYVRDCWSVSSCFIIIETDHQ